MAAAPAAGIDWKALGITIALGATGGALFRWLTIPLPWMLGAVTFTTIAAMSGNVRITMPRNIRGGFLTILGVLLGASFTPAIVARMHEWSWTAAGLAAWALVAGACAYVYLRRVAGFDPATAYFAATPGGLAEMVLVGSQVGAHVPTLALSHAVRVMLVVLVIPIWFRFEGVISAQSTRALVGLLDVAPKDYAILAACAIGGSVVATRLRIPAAGMLGPLLCSVAVHLAGITESQPPYVLTAAAQVVLGAAIGQRFTGTTPRTIATTALHGVVSTLIMLGLAVAFAATFAAFTGQSFPGLVLAYAPGGFAEMSLIALALSVDSAFVASHHLIRIILVVTLAPPIFRKFNTPPPDISEF
ncbi:MAG: AbrB family transcriptional regulator [Proteobacteria bacterium]|nr:AbrB family transcriptional regulator [Pseudomonadota bacterium]